MNIEIGHKAFVEIERAWKEFTSDQTWEGVRALKNVLQKAMVGQELDPQPDDDIVKAMHDLIDSFDGTISPNLSAYTAIAMKALARLIQAKIQKNEKGIEGVRKEVRNHESRLNAYEGRITKQDHKIRALRRKVEELEERVSHPLYRVVLEPAQPQPKGGVARDKDGHPLIPGRSVIGFTYTTGEALFRRVRKDKHHGWVIEFTKSYNEKIWPGFDQSSKVVWIRDLPFPQDSGSSKETE